MGSWRLVSGECLWKWVYFKKMDMLMSTPPQQGQLSCGFDSGEYVFMNPRVYLNQANGLDEMRDSPANSESTDGEEDLSDGLPPKKRRFGRQSGEGSSARLLADSIQKFSDIYEKIENTKRQQMLELEKMRMDFHRELEMQKRQIMERAQAEIAKMQCSDDEANDVSTENANPETALYTELWHACVGPLVTVPREGERVFYFPQGHIEQVEASTNQVSDQLMPVYNLPSKILCRVINVQLKAEPDTDEVFAQVTLLHEPTQQGENTVDKEPPVAQPPRFRVHSFCKTLTASDTSTHGNYLHQDKKKKMI